MAISNDRAILQDLCTLINKALHMILLLTNGSHCSHAKRSGAAGFLLEQLKRARPEEARGKLASLGILDLAQLGNGEKAVRGSQTTGEDHLIWKSRPITKGLLLQPLKLLST